MEIFYNLLVLLSMPFTFGEVAVRQGVFSHPYPAPAIVSSLFSAVVIMAVLTTLITPVGLRWMLPDSASTDGHDGNR